MAKRPTRSIADIEEQIKRLRDQIRRKQAKESERFAKIALDADLIELDISDEDLRKTFDDIATRFRGNAAATTGAATA